MTDIADMMEAMDRQSDEDWKATPFGTKLIILFVIMPLFLLSVFAFMLVQGIRNLFLSLKEAVAFLTRKNGGTLNISAKEQDRLEKHAQKGEVPYLIGWNINNEAIWGWTKEERKK